MIIKKAFQFYAKSMNTKLKGHYGENNIDKYTIIQQ